MTQRAGIEIKNLSFEYATGPYALRGCLRDITYEIKPGTTVLLTGDSGAGKSTFLRLISGLAPHFYPGELNGILQLSTLTEKFVPSEQPLSRAIEYSASVFQNPRTQFFTEHVDSELAFGLENLGVFPYMIHSRVDRAVELMEISGLRGRRLQELSGGQLQKLACACALTTPGDIVLFDEPTSNLSPKAIETLRSCITRLRALGMTLVIAEHRVGCMKGLVDEVLYLRDGRIQKSFSAEDFYALHDTERKHLGLRSFEPIPITDFPSSDRDDLRLENIRFSYGDNAVLSIDQVGFAAGEVTVVVGPNGSGKTTLARVICGLEKPGRGARISLNGRALSAVARQQTCYLVMQDVGRQLFAATVEEEVTLGLSPTARNYVDTPLLLKQSGLSGYEKCHPQALSGGQQQRLVIATARAQKSKVYIFDEPTSGVGWRHLKEIALHLRSLAAQGAVVIVITHDAELIEESATRLVNMENINKITHTSWEEVKVNDN